MRRKIPVLAVLLAFACALTVSAAPAYAANICGDSWGSDGHSGPWFTGGGGGTLHGNTLVISGQNCAGTMWNVTYEVVKENPSTGQQFYPIMEVRNGVGPTSFNFSVNPIGCNPGWPYYTQVRNNITGNWIRKPLGSAAIC